MLITMTSSRNFATPANLTQFSTSSPRLFHPVTAKSYSQNVRFVRTTVKLFLGLRSGSENAQLTKNPSATDSDNAITEPSTTDSSIAEATVTSNEPPLPTVQKPGSNRAPLTAREKLRAARVLSRYANESKPSKRALGSKVLDALREGDIGKGRSGLPQAPTNIFDDSKRGMPKKGLTFDLPGGADLFFVVLSFVLISTAMFSTTYLVWKLGAIHFNE